MENEKIQVSDNIPSMAPLTILGEIAVNLEEKMADGTAFMLSKQSITKAIHRKRLSVKGFLSRPKTFDDLESLPSQLMKTTDNMPFLMLNDTVVTGDPTPRAKRLLIFMSQPGRDMLASCMSWYVTEPSNLQPTHYSPRYISLTYIY